MRALLPLQTSWGAGPVETRYVARSPNARRKLPGMLVRSTLVSIHGRGVLGGAARRSPPNRPQRARRLVGMEMDEHRPGDLRGALGHHCRRTLESTAALQVETDPDRRRGDEDHDRQLTLSAA